MELNEIHRRLNELERKVRGLSTLQKPGNFTSGAVLFGDSNGKANQDATNLLWDDTNNRLTIAGFKLLGAGTSFPASPPTNGVYFHTDRGLLYYYDSTQWLTFSEYQVRFPLTTFSATTEDTTRLEAMEGDYLPYFTRVDFIVNIGATNNGSNYWDLLLRHGATTTIASTNTSASSAGTSRVRLVPTPITQPGATVAFVNVRVVKNGTPTNLDLYCVARYKFIG